MPCTRPNVLTWPLLATRATRARLISLILLLLAAGVVMGLAAAGASAAEAPVSSSTAPTIEPPKQAEVSAPVQAPTKPKPTEAQPAKPSPKPAPKKPAGAAATEFEVSAYTSEIADQMNGRINLSRTHRTSRAWLRTGYGFSRSRSFAKDKVNETELGTLNVDLGFRRGGPKSYHFVQAVASLRTRKPNVKGYPDRSGYYTISAGFGRTLFAIFDCEVSLADVSRISKEGATERLVTPVYTFGLRAPVSGSAVLGGDLRLVEPFTDNPLIDLRLNLTYKLTSAMSLRFTYLANNLLNNLLIPISSRPNTEWDKSFRISLVFGSR